MSASRGQVWLVDLGDDGKERPVLVLSAEPSDDDRPLATLIPYNSSPGSSHYDVALTDVPFLKQGVFDAPDSTGLQVLAGSGQEPALLDPASYLNVRGLD